MAVRVCATYKHICIRKRAWLDWFHITMRISVLQQQVKTLKADQPEELEAVLPRACR